MVNVSAFLSKVTDLLLTSGWSGAGGHSWEGERRENVYTSKFPSSQNCTSQRNGSFVLISERLDYVFIIQDF